MKIWLVLKPPYPQNAQPKIITSTIADMRHQEENLMRKKMSKGHSARGSQHMNK